MENTSNLHQSIFLTKDSINTSYFKGNQNIPNAQSLNNEMREKNWIPEMKMITKKLNEVRYVINNKEMMSLNLAFYSPLMLNTDEKRIDSCKFKSDTRQNLMDIGINTMDLYLDESQPTELQLLMEKSKKSNANHLSNESNNFISSQRIQLEQKKKEGSSRSKQDNSNLSYDSPVFGLLNQNSNGKRINQTQQNSAQQSRKTTYGSAINYGSPTPKNGKIPCKQRIGSSLSVNQYSKDNTVDSFSSYALQNQQQANQNIQNRGSISKGKQCQNLGQPSLNGDLISRDRLQSKAKNLNDYNSQSAQKNAAIFSSISNGRGCYMQDYSETQQFSARKKNNNLNADSSGQLVKNEDIMKQIKNIKVTCMDELAQTLCNTKQEQMNDIYDNTERNQDTPGFTDMNIQNQPCSGETFNNYVSPLCETKTEQNNIFMNSGSYYSTYMNHSLNYQKNSPTLLKQTSSMFDERKMVGNYQNSVKQQHSFNDFNCNEKDFIPELKDEFMLNGQCGFSYTQQNNSHQVKQEEFGQQSVRPNIDHNQNQKQAQYYSQLNVINEIFDSNSLTKSQVKEDEDFFYKGAKSDVQLNSSLGKKGVKFSDNVQKQSSPKKVALFKQKLQQKRRRKQESSSELSDIPCRDTVDIERSENKINEDRNNKKRIQKHEQKATDQLIKHGKQNMNDQVMQTCEQKQNSQNYSQESRSKKELLDKVDKYSSEHQSKQKNKTQQQDTKSNLIGQNQKTKAKQISKMLQAIIQIQNINYCFEKLIKSCQLDFLISTTIITVQTMNNIDQIINEMLNSRDEQVKEQVTQIRDNNLLIRARKLDVLFKLSDKLVNELREKHDLLDEQQQNVTKSNQQMKAIRNQLNQLSLLRVCLLHLWSQYKYKEISIKYGPNATLKTHANYPRKLQQTMKELKEKYKVKEEYDEQVLKLNQKFDTILNYEEKLQILQQELAEILTFIHKNNEKSNSKKLELLKSSLIKLENFIRKCQLYGNNRFSSYKQSNINQNSDQKKGCNNNNDREKGQNQPLLTRSSQQEIHMTEASFILEILKPQGSKCSLLISDCYKI
ncbi:UNKNOWN [Stylonychia lemnae]|uniref:Uncharacterized protein n=1 Tax=Stylonychia lemnae TaxID=5949 RepID=A0A078A6E2_STYLE|nr:UNKNOWN [Stylonychia lemnae]|eukprot:CDW77830.1 UNKNOWN [Stylonychia lemnae]